MELADQLIRLGEKGYIVFSNGDIFLLNKTGFASESWGLPYPLPKNRNEVDVFIMLYPNFINIFNFSDIVRIELNGVEVIIFDGEVWW